MATLTIPVDQNSSNFGIRVVLDAVPFRFDFRFNDRSKKWYFDLKDDQGNQLRSGVKVVMGTPMLLRMSSLPRPLGVLLASGASGSLDDPTRENFGVDVSLFYEEFDSIRELLGLS